MACPAPRQAPPSASAPAARPGRPPPAPRRPACLWKHVRAAATFVGVWGFCTLTYGFLGFALGWMPAAVLAVIFGMFWPLVVLLLMVAAAVILFFILRK